MRVFPIADEYFDFTWDQWHGAIQDHLCIQNFTTRLFCKESVEGGGRDQIEIVIYYTFPMMSAVGIEIDFSNFNSDTPSATAAELTKTVRTTATDNNIALVGTYGISGGGFVKMSGVGVNNTAENLVQVVTADAAAGSNGCILTEESQDVRVGTKIYFKGSTLTISILNTFQIISHPTSSRIIYLNLDNFITPGVSGS